MPLISDDEDPHLQRKPALKRKKPQVLMISSDDEDEEQPPKKKPSVASTSARPGPALKKIASSPTKRAPAKFISKRKEDVHEMVLSDPSERENDDEDKDDLVPTKSKKKVKSPVKKAALTEKPTAQKSQPDDVKTSRPKFKYVLSSESYCLQHKSVIQLGSR